MSALTVACDLKYDFPSQLHTDQLLLATSHVPTGSAAPHFFTGKLVTPRRTATLLRALMRLVRSRFHIPAAMLGRILAESDPVVTSSEGRLRFESFSGCCSAYARVDLLPGAVDGQIFGRGTTNVDFNQPMLSALAKIREGDCVELNVGIDRVELVRNAASVIEKRVALPLRWLKGFVEVQSCQSRMILVHDVAGREAVRFLRSLPRMKTNRRETFVASAGQGLRLTQIADRQTVRVGGLERLRVLEDAATSAVRMRVYADDVTGASAWELSFTDCRFCLVISPEVWRGFSGEGQALNSLALAERQRILPMVRAMLNWNAIVDEEEMHRRVAAKMPDIPIDSKMIRDALAVLGTQGLVGFDLAEGSWFHRELPFDLNAVERQHPRLKAARKLLADDQVRLGERSQQQIEILVQSADVEHRVRLLAESAKCTCPWFAKHGAARGPCKHILASRIFVESFEDGE